MPRYRIIIELDHPGLATSVDETIKPPNEWNWGMILGPDCRRINVRVYEAEPRLLIERAWAVGSR